MSDKIRDWFSLQVSGLQIRFLFRIMKLKFMMTRLYLKLLAPKEMLEDFDTALTRDFYNYLVNKGVLKQEWQAEKGRWIYYPTKQGLTKQDLDKELKKYIETKFFKIKDEKEQN